MSICDEELNIILRCSTRDIIMTRPVSLTLSDEDRNLLQNVVYRGQNWRARERAKTLLLLGEGYSKVELAQQVEVHPRTVATTRLTWLKFGSAHGGWRRTGSLEYTHGRAAGGWNGVEAHPALAQKEGMS